MSNLSVTIKNIAGAAHVSVATVSRALNNSPAVTDKTRERVFAAASKLGYVPNSVAKSLKTNHTQTIGFMVSDITNSDYISIARVVEDIVRPRGAGAGLFKDAVQQKHRRPDPQYHRLQQFLYPQDE